MLANPIAAKMSATVRNDLLALCVAAEEWGRLRAELAEANERFAAMNTPSGRELELQAVVNRLPLTADGVRIVPWSPTVVYRRIMYHGKPEVQASSGFGNGAAMFEPLNDYEVKSHGLVGHNLALCYSTREAAEAAERLTPCDP